MSDYLPDGYEKLKTQSKWLRLQELPAGEYKFRIVQKPVCGFEDWKDKKPYRYRIGQEPKQSFDPSNPMKKFWTVYWWDYTQQRLVGTTIVSLAVINGLTKLAEDEDWGNFLNYDVKIIKETKGKIVYSVMGLPAKALSSAINEAMDAYPANMQMVFEGKDPWTGKASEKASGEFDTLSEDPINKLEEALELDGVDTAYLPAFMGELATKKGKSLKEIAISALLPDWLPQFKMHYRKWLDSYKTAELPF